MYSKYHRLLQLRKSSSNSLLQRVQKSFVNSTLDNANQTFKYSATISNKDCIRLAFIYGMCGTLASYLDMHYNGKILVFKMSVPTPERFVFCAWCWAIGGITSWMYIWRKPDALIRAASSRVKYGLAHGAQTTSIALCLSFATIGFWSVYFDFHDYKIDNAAYKKALSNKEPELLTAMASSNRNNTSSHSSLSSTSATSASSSSTLIREESNEEEEELNNNTVNMTAGISDINDMDEGVKIINTVIENEDKKHIEKAENNKPILKPSKPRFESILNNMYEPCKTFFMCNAPIWIVCGSCTGMIAARVLTSAILLNPTTITTATAISLISIIRDNDNVNDDFRNVMSDNTDDDDI